MSQTDYTRNWTDVGEDCGIDRDRIAKEIEGMDWEPLTGEKPFSQGYAIQAAINEFRMPNVSAVSMYSGFGPMSLLGIEAHYANGKCRLYILDDGSTLTPLCSDFTPKEA